MHNQLVGCWCTHAAAECLRPGKCRTGRRLWVLHDGGVEHRWCAVPQEQLRPLPAFELHRPTAFDFKSCVIRSVPASDLSKDISKPQAISQKTSRSQQAMAGCLHSYGVSAYRQSSIDVANACPPETLLPRSAGVIRWLSCNHKQSVREDLVVKLKDRVCTCRMI